MKIVLKTARGIKLSFKTPENVIKFNCFLRRFNFQCINKIADEQCFIIDRLIKLLINLSFLHCYYFLEYEIKQVLLQNFTSTSISFNINMYFYKM